jgi:chemotaxis protein CheX
MTELLFTKDLVTEIASSVWTAYLPESEELLALAAPPSESSLTGTVSISGEWNGFISLTCSTIAAARAASTMFAVDVNEVVRSDSLDAVGELVNIIGGSIKGVLPPPSGLSLPAVTDGNVYLDSRVDAQLLVDVQFSWMEQSVRVAVWSKDDSAPL